MRSPDRLQKLTTKKESFESQLENSLGLLNQSKQANEQKSDVRCVFFFLITTELDTYIESPGKDQKPQKTLRTGPAQVHSL